MVDLKVSDLTIKIHDKLILDRLNIEFKAEKKTAIIDRKSTRLNSSH